MADGFRYYIGVAAEDRLYNSSLLKVICHEITPFVSGNIADTTLTEVIGLIDESTNMYEQIEVDTTNTITATHFPLFANILVPSFVKKGERVVVFRYNDSDTYYWIQLGLDKHLHTPEFFRFFVSNNPKGGAMDDKNTYFVELDTLVNKQIKLQTSKSNGESYAYTITIDTKRSKLFLSDDDGKTICLDSERDTIFMKNSVGSTVSIHGRSASIRTLDNINLKCERNIALVAGENITLKSKEITLTDMSNTSEITLNSSSIKSTVSSSGRVITSSSIEDTSNGTVMTMNASGSTQTGAAMKMSGSSSVALSAPGMSISSSGSGSKMTGNLEVQGNIDGTGNLTVAGTGSFGDSVSAPNI